MSRIISRRLPRWLRRNLPDTSTLRTHGILEQYNLNTVCESARCPNRSECYSRMTATFMILGNTCTRSCGFCAIQAGKPDAVEADEPDRVANAARELGLRYVVVTSVARDDLKDEGAGHFISTVRALRREIPDVRIEILTPDFHARPELLERIAQASPDVFNHNLETVRRLQRDIRPQADYERSLRVLRLYKEMAPDRVTKSGLMVGLGETEDEIFEACGDLRAAGCDILTLGQYLAPTLNHRKVFDFKDPAYFEYLEDSAFKMGFQEVYAGPYVRSSYHAGEVFLNSRPMETNSLSG
ncbi:MAG TPA: lipoyl synthase [bacterium]|nr:lipoyl synthase [bacterium]